jgi:asparagine synthase (glutamine-hydrolysing)
VTCIAGLFHRAGAPVDSGHLASMLDRMRSRAPHGEEIRAEGPLALGQVLLCTGTSNAEAPAPIAVDGLWICADARIDDRAELARLLRAKGRPVDLDARAGDLIAAAYRRLGDDFLAHLTGDFAFALWDPGRRRLTCARDHFGVRPFHYVECGDLFAFASDPDALLALPGVSRELDEASVADFLLFTSPRDPQRTFYRDVRCLPPACVLQVTPLVAAPRSYWQVPEDEPVIGRTPADYVEGFMDVFRRATIDRLPQGAVAAQLSGGMDSGAIAAVAAASRSPKMMAAYNVSAAHVMPDDEEEAYARLAAAHIDVPLFTQDLSDYLPYGRADEPPLWTPAPQIYPFMAAHRDLLLQIERSGAHVLLSGHGGDAVLAPSPSHAALLLRIGRLGRLAREAAHHVRHSGSMRGFGLRSALLPRRRPPVWTPPMPTWIDPAFGARVALRERWQQSWTAYADDGGAHRQLRQPWLSRNFEALEALKLPVVVRYPFHDKRLVEYLAGVPNFMKARKRILREAMRGRLPPEILNRPKTSFAGDLLHTMVASGKICSHFPREAGIYPAAVQGAVHLEALGSYARGPRPDSTWTSLLLFAPVALMNWLVVREAHERAERSPTELRNAAAKA